MSILFLKCKKSLKYQKSWYLGSSSLSCLEQVHTCSFLSFLRGCLTNLETLIYLLQQRNYIIKGLHLTFLNIYRKYSAHTPPAWALSHSPRRDKE